MRTLAAAPAVPAALVPTALVPAAVISEQAAQAQTPAARPAGAPVANGKRDAVGEPVARFFTQSQLSALRRLSELFMPPMNGNPGALEAHVPEFLDFYVGQSPAEHQHLYRSGLDLLNTRATKQFGKPFASLDAKQADAIIKPMMELVPWEFELPKDPATRFIAAANNEIRTATRNSQEWYAATVAAGRRPVGAQQYFFPVDPIYKG